MGFFDKLRNAIAGPPHVGGNSTDEAGEIAATMHEEFSVPNAGDTEMKDIEGLSETPAAPIAAAPFAGTGQIRATELEAELVEPEEVRPDEMDVEPGDDVINPDT